MKLERAIYYGAATLAVIELSKFAFSRKSKYEIVERATERFGYPASELSGRDDAPLEAAHINHDRRNDYYDNPNNGFLCTVDEHLIDHIKRAGRNGLSRDHNNRAIQSLKERVVAHFGEDYLYELLAPKPAKV